MKNLLKSAIFISLFATSFHCFSLEDKEACKEKAQAHMQEAFNLKVEPVIIDEPPKLVEDRARKSFAEKQSFWSGYKAEYKVNPEDETLCRSVKMNYTCFTKYFSATVGKCF